MPEFPAHPDCFLEWDVWFPWAESEFAGSGANIPNLKKLKKFNLNNRLGSVEIAMGLRRIIRLFEIG